VIIAVGVVLGTVLTVVSGSEPGIILSAFLIIGSVIAALAVRPGAGYLLFPVPPLAYLMAAVACGLIRDRGADNSVSGLALSAVQWAAGGFIAMIAATVLAIAIIVFRWARDAPFRAPGAVTSDRSGPAG
jgi:hypothetical protein